MLTIRLTRKGKKNQPFFRIVVIDKRRSAKGGRAVEELGYVNPLTKKNSVNKERAVYWLGVGAKATPRIHNLLVSEKIIDAKKINVFKAKKTKGGEAASAASAPVGASAPEASAPSPADETPKEESRVEPAPTSETPAEPAK